MVGKSGGGELERLEVEGGKCHIGGVFVVFSRDGQSLGGLELVVQTLSFGVVFILACPGDSLGGLAIRHTPLKGEISGSDLAFPN